MKPSYYDTFENMVTLKDASKMIKLSERTLRNWRSQGKYPEIFVKFGGRVYVDMTMVKAMIEKDRTANLKRLKL